MPPKDKKPKKSKKAEEVPEDDELNAGKILLPFSKLKIKHFLQF